MYRRDGEAEYGSSFAGDLSSNDDRPRPAWAPRWALGLLLTMGCAAGEDQAFATTSHAPSGTGDEFASSTGGASTGACLDGVTDATCPPCDGEATGGECDDECTLAFDVDCSTFEEAYLKASTPGRMDGFGWPIAVDGATVAVGADGEASAALGIGGDEGDNSAEASGAVYVFARSGTIWSQEAYIKRPRADILGFGQSLSLRGDTLAVGSKTGVFIFTRTGNTWSPDAELTAEHANAGDQFGCSIALGEDTLVVGARLEDGSAEGSGHANDLLDSGAVYVFERSGSVWEERAYLKASNAGEGDQFGVSVSLAGSTLAVGADREDSGSENREDDNSQDDSGAVYIFTRTNAGWVQDAYLKARTPGEQDRFGRAVSLGGASLAVGAHGESSAAQGVGGDQTDDTLDSSGAVYLFSRTGSTWTRDAYLKASTPGEDHQFGRSVSLRGTTLVVGAPGESTAIRGVNSTTDSSWPRDDSGAAYVFEQLSGTWQQIAHVKASNTDEGDRFGTAVELGDGFIAIGAPGEQSAARGVGGDQSNNAREGAGAVYIRRIAPTAEG